MYWCNFKTLLSIIIIGCLISGSFGCKRETTADNGKLKYFDLKGFFKADAGQLKKLNKQVVKTVVHNGVAETKTVKIDDWAQEFDLFMAADINRPAWKNSYTVAEGDGVIVYKAKEEDLKVREMTVKKENGQVKWILIFTRAQNILYKTTEKLTYFPDSLYEIEKDQHVKLMGNNHYDIKGVLSR